MIYEFDPSKFLQMNFDQFIERFNIEETIKEKDFRKLISDNRDKYTFFISGDSIVIQWMVDDYFKDIDTIHFIRLNGHDYKKAIVHNTTLYSSKPIIFTYKNIEDYFWYKSQFIDRNPKSEKPDDHYIWLEQAIRDGSFTYTVEKINKIAQNIILLLAELNIPFRVIQLGGGVKKIMKQSNICPWCKGSGMVSPTHKVTNVVYPHHQGGTI